MTSEQDIIAELKSLMPAPGSCAPEDTRLSRLQKKIIYVLFLDDPRFQKLTQRERNAEIYENVLGGNTNSARANLSRAYRGLEEKHLIQRIERRWELTSYANEIALKVFCDFEEKLARKRGTPWVDSDDEEGASVNN
jgi:hypothetical protein